MTKKKVESASLLFAAASRIAAKNKKKVNCNETSRKKNKPYIKPQQIPKSQKK